MLGDSRLVHHLGPCPILSKPSRTPPVVSKETPSPLSLANKSCPEESICPKDSWFSFSFFSSSFLPFFVFVLWGGDTCMMYVHTMRVHVLCEGVPGTQLACGSPQPQVPILTFHLV